MKRSNLSAKFLISVTVAAIVGVTQSASALTTADYALQGIDFYHKNAGACAAPTVSGTGTTTGGGAEGAGNADYKGRKIVSDDQMKKIKEHQPTYEKAAKEASIPWQILAVLHLRETGLSRSNPNDDGLYQIVSRSYPRGATSDQEFLSQSIDAAKFFKGKAGSQAGKLATGDAGAVKQTFFSYNGTAAAYTRQAKQLGFDNGYEGSPYVMNIADAKRDPAVNKTTWGQIKTDGGGLSYPANSDYGAFVVYAALAGIPSGGGDCSGGAVDPRVGPNGWEAAGANAMVLYYQYKSPWATQSYGGKGTIKECGCGPTSMAMAVATLKKDKTITPKTMADFFAGNGGQVGGASCASTWSLFTSSSVLAKKFDLEITSLGTDMSKVGPAVKSGSFVLMSQGPGQFTSTGHLMLIRGVTSDGNYRFGDPISEERTTNEKGYTAGQIKAALMGLWEIRLKGGN